MCRLAALAGRLIALHTDCDRKLAGHAGGLAFADPPKRRPDAK